MKSKPSSKKVKVEVTNLGPPPSTPENQKNSSTPCASPGSSSSTASSLLSIGPSFTGNVTQRAGSDNATAGPSGASAITGSGAATAKSAGKSKGAASKDVDKGSGPVQSAPAFPILTHFNLADFPKINACLVGSKGPTAGGSAGNAAGAVAADANKSIDNLTMEDIDTLQTELETLWSSVATRIRLINREQGTIQTASSSTSHHHHNLEHFDPQHQEKIAAVATIIDHGTRTSVSAAAKLVMGAQLAVGGSPVPSPSAGVQPPSGPIGKRNTTKGERLPKKKLKGEGAAGGGKSKKAGGGGGEKPAARATQNRSHSVSSDLGAPDVIVNKSLEAPNQFWEFVHPYCKEVTREDVSRLEAIYEDQRHLPRDIFDIPPLGKHFRDDEETAKRRARESRMSSSRDTVGPLTQRLVSALVDEKVSMNLRNYPNSPKEDAGLASPGCSSNPEGGLLMHRQGLSRALGLDAGGAGPSKPNMESRLRDLLLENDLLLPDDAVDPLIMDPDDEVMAEIKRTLGLLNQLHTYNSDKLAGMIAHGKKELDRSGHQRDLEKADKDVIEAYKAVAGCRLKKKPISKKEKDGATKALDTRKKALGKLEAIQGTSKKGGGGGGGGGGTSANLPRGANVSAALGAAVAPVDPAGTLHVQV